MSSEQQPAPDQQTARGSERRDRPLWGDLLFSVGILALGGYFAYGAFQVRLLGGYSQIGPRFFPLVVAGGMIVCGALLAVQALRGKAAPLEEGEDVDVTVNADWGAVGIIVAALAATIVLMERAGFVIACTVLFWGVAFAFGSRHYLRDPLIGVLLATVVYLAFTRLLGLRLPSGILPFHSLWLGF